MNNLPRYCIIGVVVIGLIWLVGYFDDQTSTMDARRYCAQVHRYQQSDGAIGWPDYDGTYATQCTPDGKLAPSAGG